MHKKISVSSKGYSPEVTVTARSYDLKHQNTENAKMRLVMYIDFVCKTH
jgi:hypothetical protein